MSIYQTKRHTFTHKSGAMNWEELVPAPENGRSIVVCDIVGVGMTSLEIKDSKQASTLSSENRIVNSVAGAEQAIHLLGLNIVTKNSGASLQAKTAGSGDHCITITYYLT